MSVAFSIVYPTRHRPDFIRQALRILEEQGQDNFEVVVCDNYVDSALSCERICADSRLPNLRYIRPPRPLGMIANWNHALQFATGDYVAYLTDKMFVLPGALARVERAIDRAAGPDIVSWTSDFYTPATYADYFGHGSYITVLSDVRRGLYRPYSPAEELDRRGRAEQSRGEQQASSYCRGKLVFGAYRRGLVDQTVARYGSLFHNINPDYTSMVLGLTEAHDAIELDGSCVVSVNTDLSNGMLCDTNDAAALAFLNSLAGGAASVLPRMLVPGLYVSVHNWVAHDFLSLQADYDLSFEFDTVNWLVYCMEDVDRPGRRWSDPTVEAAQKRVLRTFVESFEPPILAAVQSRLAARAVPPRRPLLRRILGRAVPPSWRGPAPWAAPSIQAAVERFVAAGS